MAKSKKQEELEQQLGELTLDLKRTRADFENYRKRMESEKESARSLGKTQAVLKLLPVIDNIERAITHTPDDIKDNAWVKSVANLVKHLEKSLDGLDLKRISAKPGDPFDPLRHEAIQFDEESEGEHEVIAEELQSGYMLGGEVVRPAMVKVTRQ
ncbi:nucleotide exchange factor GrpE [Candidatus Saccharibacteria bacterium]|nr:MAG: nucleotide exchange factor GrpE [Candidatus Saccharibacteria bacterium]